MDFDPKNIKNQQSFQANTEKYNKRVKVYEDGSRVAAPRKNKKHSGVTGLGSNIELDESLLGIQNQEDEEYNEDNDYGYDEQHQHHHHHHHHHHSKKKKIIAIVCIVLAVIILIVGVGAGLLSKYYNKMNIEDTTDDYSSYLSDKETVNEDDTDVTNILLIGTDNRAGLAGTRSDSIMILSINPKNKKIIMTSVLRDCYIEIPGEGQNRINAAYNDGGADLLLATIQYNFGIKLEKYVQVDFESFQKIIDQLGGVDVELTKEEIAYYGWSMSPGTNTLDGTKALEHARNRHIGTDFERTRRQRDIIMAMLAKAKTASASELVSMVDTFLPEVTTNLTKSDLLELSTKAANYSSYTSETYSIPMSGTYKDMTVNGMEVLDIDCGENAKIWYDAVYK